MFSRMMKSMMKKELSALHTVLKKVNVYTIREEKKLYNCCILNGLVCKELGEETSHEVIYTLNENCAVGQGDITTSEYGSCNVDVMKPRWTQMAENGYNMKETIKFQFESAWYVRIVVHVTNQFYDPQGHLSRIEFAFGNITLGVSYILPLYVWDQRYEEIEDIFTNKGNGPSNDNPGGWTVIATNEVYA